MANNVSSCIRLLEDYMLLYLRHLVIIIILLDCCPIRVILGYEQTGVLRAFPECHTWVCPSSSQPWGDRSGRLPLLYLQWRLRSSPVLSLSLAWFLLLPSEWCVQLSPVPCLILEASTPGSQNLKIPRQLMLGPEDHEWGVRQPNHPSKGPCLKKGGTIPLSGWDEKIKEDWTLDWLGIWGDEMCWGSRVRLREGLGRSGTERCEGWRPDELVLPSAVLGNQSSNPCSQPHCCLYKGALDVTKERWENKKITSKSRGSESKK